MSNLTPHQKKALIIDGHLALTANAGSGKTFVLARKYLSILQKNNIDVNNVAAITFTEKAASELYSKISILIDEEIKKSINIAEHKKLEKIRRQLVSANISTIHSFCIDILKQFPVESQLDARFTAIDENLSSELIEISVEETIRAAFDNNQLQNSLKYLIRFFGSKIRLEDEIVNMIKDRKNVLAVSEKIYSRDEKEIQKHFADLFDEYFLLIWERKKVEFINALNEINSLVLDSDSENLNGVEIGHKLQQLRSENDAKVILNLIKQIIPLAFTTKNEVRQQGYLKKDLRDTLSTQILISQDIVSELSDLEISEESEKTEKELAKFGKIILEYFHYSLSNYESKKMSEGYVDFEDILLHTKILLSNNDVKKSLHERYKFILVDEFQDTNEIQYQIFLPILNYLKSGNLIIVGDEKQSIYKFRDAEIEVFNLTKRQIINETSNENVLSLPDSFRMSPSICVFTNHIFGKLFSNPDELYNEVPNTELVCARQGDVEGNIEFLISEDDSKDNSENESDLVAKKILYIISKEHYSFKDICILVRKRKSFDELEKSFLLNKIPYSIIGGRGFYQRQTISDIYNYLSFLVDENNSSALVGLLRSPFFTVSDSELFEISLKKGNSFWKKLQTYSVDNPTFQKIISILEENIRLSDSFELPQLLKKLVTEQNYLSVITSRIDGEQELANFEKLISMSRNFNSKGFRNLFDFINYLKESIAGLANEAQAAFSAENNSVQMMTIHQAKGLEFPIVFLFQTSEKGVSGSVKSGQIKVDKKFGILSKVPINENYFDEYKSAPIVSIYNFIESKKNLAELKRLLYVGVTRAKDELFISAALDDKKAFPNDSFISLISSGLNNKFDENKIVLNEELKYLTNKNGEFSVITKTYKLNIPITRKIEFSQEVSEEFVKTKTDYINQLQVLQSSEKGEIISASKVSIFSQCPIKYDLTYNYGYSKLNNYKFKIIKNGLSQFSFNKEEEREDEIASEIENEINFDAADRGRLIHLILENELTLAQIDEFIKKYRMSNRDLEFNDQNIIDNVKIDLSIFFKSKFYEKINSFKNFKNEFEIYIQDEDYFLHGIIDKLAFNGKEILIFDYKTDDIKKDEIEKRGEFYLMQLKFYLYIASKLFKEFDHFEGNLVFIKHPDHPIRINYDENSINKLQDEIKSLIKDLRQDKKEKNLTHCNQCAFSDFTNKCIIN